MSRITWTPDLDRTLTEIAEDRPEASASMIATWFGQQTGVKLSRKAVHHRMSRLGLSTDRGGAVVPRPVVAREGETRPVQTEPIRYRDRVPAIRRDDDRIAFVFGDAQYPYCSMPTHEALIGLLEGERPDVLVLNGDMIDLPTLSAHRAKPELLLEGGLNAELAFAYARLHEIAEAAGPACRKVMLEGNHELRARTALIDRLPTLYGVRQQGDANAPALLSMSNLLGLEHLGYEYLEGYPHATVALADDLMVTHGDRSRRGSGNTVRAYLDQFPGISYIVGHVHRAALVSRAMQTPTGLGGTQWGVETGTLSALSGHEMGYLTGPDWTPGGVAVSFSGGTWSLELITGRVLSDGRVELSWRGRRYTSRSDGRSSSPAPVLRVA